MSNFNYYKEVVGTRQRYRRVAKEVRSTLQGIISPIVNDGASTSNHQPLDWEFDSESNQLVQNQNNVFNDFNRNINDEGSSDINSNHEDAQFDGNIPLMMSESNINGVLSDNDIINESSISQENDINTVLKQWAIRKKVPHSVLNDLLFSLSPFHPSLPLNSRTLLDTPRSRIGFKKLENGDLCYFGIEEYLTRFLSVSQLDCDTVRLSFNIDGLPLYHSSALQFWPILGLIKNKAVVISPFAISIFCGKTKPSPLSSFFEDFINELKHLKNNGLIHNKKQYKIEIENFICDAPARAFVKCVKTHGGYSACDKCVEEGDYFNGRMIYKGTSAQRRTDASFLSQQDQEHHTGLSPLLALDVGLVSRFPIDYMHCVCLGVMKKLLMSWIKGNLNVRLNSRLVTIISDWLISMKISIPDDFNRKPRSLSELPRWKATEFRTFLLYLGPVVLKDIVDKAIYEHFLLFHCGISILASARNISNIGIELAREMLNIFVSHSENIYGQEFLVYNVHMLSHLTDDVNIFGPLDSFSAFPFENFLGQIKKLIRSSKKPLEQIYCRLKELSQENKKKCKDLNKTIFSLQHSDGPVIAVDFNYTQFKKMSYRGMNFSIKSHTESNAYCLLKNNQVFQIHNIVTSERSTYLIGKHFTSYEEVYSYPITSKQLHIYLIDILSDFEIWNVDDIVTKCLVITSNNGKSLVSFPLLHNESYCAK